MIPNEIVPVLCSLVLLIIMIIIAEVAIKKEEVGDYNLHLKYIIIILGFLALISIICEVLIILKPLK